MKAANRIVLLFMSLAVVSGLIIFSAANAGAGPIRVLNGTTPERLTVTVGKSLIVESQTPIKRFSIPSPQVADVLVLTPRQLYLTGKAAGLTSLTLWGEGDKLTAVFEVEVAPDIASLKAKLHEAFPEERDIKVTAARDSVTLSGTVSDAATLSQVLSIAQAYAPGDKEGKRLLNLLEVGVEPRARSEIDELINHDAELIGGLASA